MLSNTDENQMEDLSLLIMSLQVSAQNIDPLYIIRLQLVSCGEQEEIHWKSERIEGDTYEQLIN